MKNKVYFWMRSLSPHMMPVINQLNILGMPVTVLVEYNLSNERLSMGWQVPFYENITVISGVTKENCERLLCAEPISCVHIIQGFRGNGICSYVQAKLRSFGMKYWVVLETVDLRGIKRWILPFLYRYYSIRDRKYVEGILAIGKETKKWLTDQGFEEQKIWPFAYFVDSQIFRANDYLTNTVSCADIFRFIFVGSLVHLKKVDMLLKAISKLGRTDIELWVVGDGPKRSILEELSEQLNVSTKWFGIVDMRVISELLVQADCLVLPSEHDGWGAVVNEAIMMGTPVICSDACGAAELVHASSVGGVFQARNQNSLNIMIEKQTRKGCWKGSDRNALFGWAECISPFNGARYLIDILSHVHSGGHMQPQPPWRRLNQQSLSED